jgi:hypothetical protein
MATLEDGTVFQQNISHIEAESSKVVIRPMVLEHNNSKANKISHSKNKPLLSNVDKATSSESSDRLIFKNYMDGSCQTI